LSVSVLSARAFARVIRAGDSQRFAVNLKTERSALIDAAVNTALQVPATLPEFHATVLRGKPCVSYSDFSTNLILRSIARHLQQRLAIRPPNRDQIVLGVIQSLMDSTPMYVMRRDISSFYEHIPISPLRDRLLYDTASSLQIRAFLRAYFDQHCGERECGLPRGVGLSAILAEIAMRDFDQQVREIPGVYKYYRFSDDIIVFAFSSHDSVAEKLSQALPGGMRFNVSKSHDLDLSGTARTGQASVSFDYLGYSFAVTPIPKGSHSRTVSVRIASGKLNRIKTRIILSLNDHRRDRNFFLLRDRVRFLTSNYRLRRSGVSSVSSTHILSGIFFNYRHCGDYVSRGQKFKFTPSSANELKALDGFFHSLIKGRGSSFSSMLTPLQKQLLSKYSFFQGYSRRILARYSNERVGEIKSAWYRHA
jgi:hypothetical protein